MSDSRGSIEHLVGCIAAQIDWRTEMEAPILGVTHNLTKTRQVFLGRGKGWKLVTFYQDCGAMEIRKIIPSWTWQPWSLMTKEEPTMIKQGQVIPTTQTQGRKHIGALMKSLVNMIEDWSPNTDKLGLKCPGGEEYWIFMKQN